MGVCAEGDAKGASETEITDLEVSVLVDEQVLRLEVAVKDTVGMAVADAGEQLVRELLDLDKIMLACGVIAFVWLFCRSPCLLPIPSDPCHP